MKIYDDKLKIWKIKDDSEEKERDLMRAKLMKQNIPFTETSKGLFITDEDEAKIK